MGDVALLGGSLAIRGGQNPIEPIKLETAILHGPHVTNFSELYRELDASEGAAEVTDADSLAAAASSLLGDREARTRMIEAGQATVARLGGALERTLAAIDPYLVQIRLQRH